MASMKVHLPRKLLLGFDQLGPSDPVSCPALSKVGGKEKLREPGDETDLSRIGGKVGGKRTSPSKKRPRPR